MTNHEHEPQEQLNHLGENETIAQSSTLLPTEEITIISDTPAITESLQRGLEIAGITDAIVVMAEMRTEANQNRSQMPGLDIALEQAKSLRPMAILSFQDPMGRDSITDPRIQALLGHPHVTFLRLPAGSEQVAEAIRVSEARERPADPLAIELLSLEVTTNQLSVIQHDYQKVDPANIELVTPFIERVRALGITGTDPEIQQILDGTIAESTPFAGRSLPGLFCDIEGTLVRRDGTIDENVVALLNKQSTRMPITIWTGGDADGYRETLADILPYKVVSKHLFRDAEVEFALDDLPQDVLEQSYGVKVRGYLDVSRLQEKNRPIVETRDWDPDGDDLFEYLWAENPDIGIDELLARVAKVPESEINNRDVIAVLGAHLHSSTTPIEDIRRLGEALTPSVNWNAVIEDVIETMEEAFYKDAAELLQVYRRLQTLDPTYQPTPELVSAIIRSFRSDDNEFDAEQIREVFSVCGIDSIGAFSGETPAKPFSTSNNWFEYRKNFSTARLIVESAVAQGIEPDMLKLALHPDWWKVIQEYAQDQSDYLYDACEKDGNDPSLPEFAHAHEAVRFLER